MYVSKTMLLLKISSCSDVNRHHFIFHVILKCFSNLSCSFKKLTCLSNCAKVMILLEIYSDFNMINTILTEYLNFMRRRISVNVRNII